MKIIFSRKGFDSGSGGGPSPIFPDGRMLSLPIPDKQSGIKYQEIPWNEYNLGEIVSPLTKGRVRPSHNAHLDPDLNMLSLPRSKDWKPIFGQTAAAQGHLRNNGVAEGDVFLFFGLFKEVIQGNGVLAWKRDSPCKHIVWGWLQVGQIIPIESPVSNVPLWANYHPHLQGHRGANNTLYIAKDAGIFSHYSKKLQLTLMDSLKTSIWQLPRWMYPENGKTPLSYHSNLERWNKQGSTARLTAASRGQEFVLNAHEYPEADAWLQDLMLLSQ